MQSSSDPQPKVWLVDDSPTQLALARHILAPLCEALCLTDGESVLERLKDEQPDLIILDWNLPKASGLEVCREIRKTLDQASLPVLVLTSDDATETVVVALEAGANDYVRKPPRKAELLARVRALLRTKQLNDSLHVARLQAEKANRSKDEFIGVVSHELRTPLHAILGWSELLLRGTFGDAERKRALETIRRNAQHQSSLIDELLDTTRLAIGKLTVERLRVDIGALVQSSTDSLQPLAEQKKVKLEVDIDRDIYASADPGRFQQVASNLVSNAIKFSPPDAPVQVRLQRKGDTAELVVSDRGRGIAPDFLAHVFEQFRQEPGRERRAGLGLGLAIVKSLVELHGGTVEAKSDGLDKGATFVVRIPVESPAPAER